MSFFPMPLTLTGALYYDCAALSASLKKKVGRIYDDLQTIAMTLFLMHIDPKTHLPHYAKVKPSPYLSGMKYLGQSAQG